MEILKTSSILSKLNPSIKGIAELSPIIFGAINISPASITFSLKAVEISPLPPSKRTESIPHFPNSFNISSILNKTNKFYNVDKK